MRPAGRIGGALKAMARSGRAIFGSSLKRRVGLWVPLSFFLLAGGCAENAAVAPRPAPLPPAKEIARMGYSIQVGAFLDVDNAIRLTHALEEQGLPAYYFRHETGMYKVRFGNFPSKEAAVSKAQSLSDANIIQDYYVVSPDEYAVAKIRIYGTKGLRNELVETAERFIGLPYQWGGSSPEQGFDCSGLTMAVYQYNGINLPRSSKEQFSHGTPVERSELEQGDLVFFSTKTAAKVSHVGLYSGDNRFIHAPRTGKTIREDSLSDPYFAARYAGARTYLR
jgi:cell wall-associated NlpC family hydrolase